jgi:hypothetical protein
MPKLSLSLLSHAHTHILTHTQTHTLRNSPDLHGVSTYVFLKSISEKSSI